MEYRVEHDSMGEIKVPTNRLWGAQTQRSFENFKIGTEKMPLNLIYALAAVKKACAITNCKIGKLDEQRCKAITEAADEIIQGKLDAEFPLAVWQTGSGTQTNMNVNEVIAHRAEQLYPQVAVHPNDHVNMSQSSNDVFPAAMHVAAVTSIENNLLPALNRLAETFIRLEKENEGIVKTGRTHLQDATPVAFSQEISGWRTMVETAAAMITASLPQLRQLALGGTAVGTGLNAHKDFAVTVAQQVSAVTDTAFETAPNKFHALTSKDALAFTHGALKALAANLMKIANDVRWMAAGPRCGLGEISIPENEPGSSIMPGKVNPTQCEAVTMVVVQVMGNDTTIGVAASQGNFELNVFMPVIIYNFLQSVALLADCVDSFNDNCISGMVANKEKMEWYLNHSLMLITALNPVIGYDNGAKVVKKAFAENCTLKEAAVSLGVLSADDYDKYIKPEQMV